MSSNWERSCAWGVTDGAYFLTQVAMRFTNQVHGLLSVSPLCKDFVVYRVVHQHELFGICSMGGKAQTSSKPSRLFKESASSQQDSKSRRSSQPYWLHDITTTSRGERRTPDYIEHVKCYEADHEKYKERWTTYHVSKASTMLDESKDSAESLPTEKHYLHDITTAKNRHQFQNMTHHLKPSDVE